MSNKWKIYKAIGKVSYFVTDIMAPSKKGALEIANDCVGDDVSFAAGKGNIEILELTVEPLRPVTKKEVIKGHGKEYWEHWEGGCNDGKKEINNRSPG